MRKTLKKPDERDYEGWCKFLDATPEKRKIMRFENKFGLYNTIEDMERGKNGLNLLKKFQILAEIKVEQKRITKELRKEKQRIWIKNKRDTNRHNDSIGVQNN